MPGARIRGGVAIAIALVSILSVPAGAAQRLPELGADPSLTSVSGLSSGAFMAVQYHVAFSASVKGIGVVAGGPYDCVHANAGGIATCMGGAPLGAASLGAASSLAALGRIDPVENLARARVYLFSGTKDAIIRRSVMDAVRDFYDLAGVKGDNLLYVNDVAAGHAFISAGFGGECPATAAPFVNKCSLAGRDYDQPGAILAQIYGTLASRAAVPSSAPFAFDQTEFNGPASGMAKTGYVYVPQACRSGKGCAVHVVLHGCEQGSGEVKDDVYARLGFNEWADTNRIIVLYPQLDPTLLPFNPKGCWDWWGYSGPDFQTRSGGQLAAVHAMVDRLSER